MNTAADIAETRGHTIWRELALVAVSVVVALAGAWATWADEAISASEARYIVRTESPYTKDRGAIQLQLSQQTQAIADLTTAIVNLTAAQAELRQEVALLRARR
jgi:regulator of sirC expression with transglutaminase-like and TPR domain